MKGVLRYAFPQNLEDSFCYAVTNLTPGARDKDRIVEIIAKGLCLKAPPIVAALSGYAASDPGLLADLLVLAGGGLLDVARRPVWIEHETAEGLGYLDLRKDRRDSLPDARGETGYCFFVPDSMPDVTGIAFVCSVPDVTIGPGIANPRSGGLSFLPYVAYIDRAELARRVDGLRPSPFDRLRGRYHDARAIRSLQDAEAPLIASLRLAPLPDLVADARIVNGWSNEQVSQYGEQAAHATLHAAFRAVSALVLIQLRGIEAGLPGHPGVVTGKDGAEAIWRTPRFSRRITVQVRDLSVAMTGQVCLATRPADAIATRPGD